MRAIGHERTVNYSPGRTFERPLGSGTRPLGYTRSSAKAGTCVGDNERLE